MGKTNKKTVFKKKKLSEIKKKASIFFAFIFIISTFIQSASAITSHNNVAGIITIKSSTPTQGDFTPEKRGIGGDQSVLLKSENTFETQTVYERTITINNNNSFNLEDYPIRIDLNTEILISQGKLDSACGGIRITDSFRNKTYAHWIEDDYERTPKNRCGTANTGLWINLPYIPQGQSKITLQYGQSITPNPHNPDNIFTLFDDFNTGINTSKWDITGSNVETVNGVLRTYSNESYIVSKNPIPYSTKYGYEGIVKSRHTSFPQTATDNSMIYIGFEETSTTNRLYAGIYKNTVGDSYVLYYLISGFQTFADMVEDANEWKYIVLKSSIAPNNSMAIRKFFPNYITQNQSSTFTNTIEENEKVKIGGTISSGQNSVFEWDFVIIKKLAPLEPSITIGAEQNAKNRIFIGGEETQNIDENESILQFKTTNYYPKTNPEIEIINKKGEYEFYEGLNIDNPKIFSILPSKTSGSGGEPFTVYGENFDRGAFMIPIEVSYTDTTELEERPVMIRINTSAMGSKFNCQNFSFYEFEYLTEKWKKLPSAVEGQCPNTSTILWTKTNLIPEGTKTIYLAYNLTNKKKFLEPNKFSELFWPLESTSKIIHLKAHDQVEESGSSVNSWTGKISFGQETASNRPTLIQNVINNFPVVRFAGNHFLTSAGSMQARSIFNSNLGNTMVFVGKMNDGYSNSNSIFMVPGSTESRKRYVFKVSDPSSQRLQTTYDNTNETASYNTTTNFINDMTSYGMTIGSISYIEGKSVYYRNGTLNATSNPTATSGFNNNSSINDLYIGAFENGGTINNHMHGDIAEMIIFKGNLLNGTNIYNTNDPRNSQRIVEDYLLQKYQIPSDLKQASVSVGQEKNNSYKAFLGRDTNGNGFYSDDLLIEISSANLNYINENKLEMTFPNIFEDGNWDLILINIDGSRSIKKGVIRKGKIASAPRNLSVIPGGTEAMISFDTPIESGGTEIDSYEIRYATVNAECDVQNYHHLAGDCQRKTISASHKKKGIYIYELNDSSKEYKIAVFPLSKNNESELTAGTPSEQLNFILNKNYSNQSSTISTNKNSILPDNEDKSIITITIRDANGIAIPNSLVIFKPDNDLSEQNPAFLRAIDCNSQETKAEFITDQEGKMCVEIKFAHQTNGKTFHVITNTENSSLLSTTINSSPIPGGFLQKPALGIENWVFRYGNGNEENAFASSKVSNANEQYIYHNDIGDENPIRLRFGITNYGIPVSMKSEILNLTANRGSVFDYPQIIEDFIYLAKTQDYTSLIEKTDTEGTVFAPINFSDFSITATAKNETNKQLFVGGTSQIALFETKINFIKTEEFPSVKNTLTLISSPITKRTIVSLLSAPEHENNGMLYALTDDGGIHLITLNENSYSDYSNYLLGNIKFLTASLDEKNRYIYATGIDTSVSNEYIYLMRIFIPKQKTARPTITDKMILSTNFANRITSSSIDSNKNMLYLTLENKVIKIDIDPAKKIRRVADLIFNEIGEFSKLSQVDSINRYLYLAPDSPVMGINERPQIIKINLDTFSNDPATEKHILPILASEYNISNGILNPENGFLITTNNLDGIDQKITVTKTKHEITPKLKKYKNNVCPQEFNLYEELSINSDLYFAENTMITNGEPTGKNPQNASGNLLPAGAKNFKAGFVQTKNVLNKKVYLGEKEYSEFEYAFKTNDQITNEKWCLSIFNDNGNPFKYMLKQRFTHPIIDWNIPVMVQTIIDTKETSFGSNIYGPPSAEIIAGSAETSYVITLKAPEPYTEPDSDVYISFLNDEFYSLEDYPYALSNNQPALSLRAASQPIINNRIILNGSRMSETIFIRANKDSIPMEKKTYTIIHISEQEGNDIYDGVPINELPGDNIRPIEVTVHPEQSSVSMISVSVSGNVIFETPLPDEFSFPETSPGNKTPNFISSPINLNILDTTETEENYVLQLQTGLFSSTGEPLCEPSISCIPLNHVYITTNNYSNENEIPDYTTIANFVESYLPENEDINNPNIFRNNANLSIESSPSIPFTENNIPQAITLIDTANTSANTKGKTEIDLHFMIDYPNFSNRLPGTYQIELTFTLIK